MSVGCSLSNADQVVSSQAQDEEGNLSMKIIHFIRSRRRGTRRKTIQDNSLSLTFQDEQSRLTEERPLKRQKDNLLISTFW